MGIKVVDLLRGGELTNAMQDDGGLIFCSEISMSPARVLPHPHVMSTT